MLKDCTEESKPVYLETVKQANEKLQKMLSDPQVILPAVIKSEPKNLINILEQLSALLQVSLFFMVIMTRKRKNLFLLWNNLFIYWLHK